MRENPDPLPLANLFNIGKDILKSLNYKTALPASTDGQTTDQPATADAGKDNQLQAQIIVLRGLNGQPTANNDQSARKLTVIRIQSLIIAIPGMLAQPEFSILPTSFTPEKIGTSLSVLVTSTHCTG